MRPTFEAMKCITDPFITNPVLRSTDYYMSLAYMVSMQSEDTSTRIGAVIVGPDKEIRSTGYNGFPRGCEVSPERMTRPEKYSWVEHAERNAIFNAARMGISVKDCIIFVNALPCPDCARAIIQSGISHVIYHLDFEAGWGERSAEERSLVDTMLREGGVALNYYDGDLIKAIQGFRNGKLVDL